MSQGSPSSDCYELLCRHKILVGANQIFPRRLLISSDVLRDLPPGASGTASALPPSGSYASLSEGIVDCPPRCTSSPSQELVAARLRAVRKYGWEDERKAGLGSGPPSGLHELPSMQLRGGSRGQGQPP